MAVDIEPFNDRRVRQAFRLIADRQELINGALSGFATPGNDLPGRGLPNWLAAPVRKRDPERAKFLLRQAGQEDLSVTLQTSNVVPGFIEAATLFAQQAKAAGVDVKVKRESATAYFDTSLLYTKMAFAQSFWTVTALGQWYPQSLISSAVWNETHWRQRSYDRLIRSAIGAPNAALARRRWREMQQIQYDEGGYIVWANINSSTLSRKRQAASRPSRSSASVAGTTGRLARTERHVERERGRGGIPAAARPPHRCASGRARARGHRDAARGLRPRLPRRRRCCRATRRARCSAATATPEQLARTACGDGPRPPAAERYRDWLGGLATGDSASRLRASPRAHTADLGRDRSGEVANTLVLAARHGADHGAAGDRARRARRRCRARPADSTTPISLTSLAIDLAARVRHRHALDRSSSPSWLGWLPPISLDPARREPAVAPEGARAARADAARRGAGRTRSGWCGPG